MSSAGFVVFNRAVAAVSHESVWGKNWLNKKKMHVTFNVKICIKTTVEELGRIYSHFSQSVPNCFHCLQQGSNGSASSDENDGSDGSNNRHQWWQWSQMAKMAATASMEVIAATTKSVWFWRMVAVGGANIPWQWLLDNSIFMYMSPQCTKTWNKHEGQQPNFKQWLRSLMLSDVDMGILVSSTEADILPQLFCTTLKVLALQNNTGHR